MRNEVKVGIFIFLGLVSLIFLTLQVNSLQDFNKKGYVIYADIGDASGLAKKAKVKMRGVVIGNVEDMKLKDSYVELKLFIKKGIKIPVDSYVTLSQDNFLGGKYIKIIPSNSFTYYKKNEIIKKYINSTSMEDVMANINIAVDDIKVLIKKLNTTLDDKTISNIKQIISNVKDSSIILKTVLKNSNNLINEYKNLGVTLNKKIPTILNNANNLVLEYKSAGEKINQKLPTILNKAESLLAKFNKTGDILNKKLAPLMDEYTKLGKNANEILNDNKTGLKETVASAKGFFESGSDSFKKIDKYLSSLTKSQLMVDIQSNYMSDDDYFKTNAYISYLPTPTKYYIFGVTSSKDYSNLSKVNLKHQEDKILVSAEYGKRFNNLLLRGGIIENTGGIGFDYFFNNDKFKLSSDIYDFNAVNDVRGNSPHLSMKGTYLYLKHIEFVGGIDNILNTNARTYFLGLGVKFKDNDLKTLLSGGASSFLK